MSRPARKPSKESVDAAKALIRSARTAEEIRTAQAVLLPLEMGLSAAQVAVVVGRSTKWVSRARIRFMEEQFVPGKRGGRRNELISQAQEVEAVKLGIVIHRSRRNYTGRHLRDSIRYVVEKWAGRSPAESTLSGIMLRAARQLVPSGETWELDRIPEWQLSVWREEVEFRGLMAI